ncbi:YceI family protein [Mucilaginibacter sp.]|uniref:YceI family protein n=1 Tax=Mucilaginibacter sp. TaxID=1882438 RepID=UPI0025F3C97C|nr:YceI family protein [Mucilaginibacter sp.]
MTTTWKIDPSHSEVQFKVKHLMITTISGHFHNYDLEVLTEGDDFTTASKIEFSADVDSISTKNEQRDAHLKSAEFFNAEEHVVIRFGGNKFEQDADEYLLHGDLTIKGITKPILLHVDFGGIVVDPYGQTKAGFTVTGKISRKEFGLTWDAVTEAGQIVVSDEIRINCDIQLIKS